MSDLNSLNSKIASAETDYSDERYVIFNLAENVFAVNCKYVVSIEKSTQITEIANAPPGVRGVGYYKHEAINIIDLRVIFGYPSHEYYIENEININGHIAEHESWADEIKAGAAPGFTENPLDCDLGKWLAGYKTDSMSVKNLIQRIGPVHEKFHKLADKAADYSSGDQEKADRFFAETDSVKNELTLILNELHEALLKQAKELPIILKINNKKIGIVVDDVESVDTMDEIQNLPPAAAATEYIKKLGFRKKDNQITLILEAELFA